MDLALWFQEQQQDQQQQQQIPGLVHGPRELLDCRQLQSAVTDQH
jgi:hypothetical protein